MDRKSFLKSGIVSAVGLAAGKIAGKTEKNSTYDKLRQDVGFNHLPVESTLMKTTNNMKTVIHRANTRGHANHGWLDSHHSFSFASYRNPERMNFGVLRVLNDDVVAGGMGFGTHPHDNMEIISIPLAGALEHKDSMGNTSVIRQGDVQVMSAGTGIYHSEYNEDKSKEVRFLQIWMFPSKKNVTPRYDQISVSDHTPNQFNQILSPSESDAGVWVHQNAWFHLGSFDKSGEVPYKVKGQNNGVYAFIIEGGMTIGDTKLSKRDGIGLWDMSEFNLSIEEGSQILLMEVPMSLG